MPKAKSICVYCASSSRVNPCYSDAAYSLGALLAQKGITLITGAGCQGLMRAVEDGALENGGKAVGVIPAFMVEQNWQHPSMSELHITEDMHSRKQKMAQLSEAVIALPGGCGTMEELLEIITWKQLGLYLGPIIILNVNGYYDQLIAQLERAIDECFMGKIHGEIWSVATTAEEAVQIAKSTPRWECSVRKYAAL